MTDFLTPGLPPLAAEASLRQLQRKAVELEAVFLAEMLGHMAPETGQTAMGGGIGETQFSSLLRQEQARAIAERGGIGLAEHIFTTLSRARDLAE